MIDSFSRGIMLVDRRIKKIGGVVNFVIDRNDSNVWAGIGDSKLLNTCHRPRFVRIFILTSLSCSISEDNRLLMVLSFPKLDILVVTTSKLGTSKPRSLMAMTLQDTN